MQSGLVVELDGGQHADSVERDQQRDRWLAANGFTVLRFWNDQVMKELPAVLELIHTALSRAQPPSPLPPLPQAGEGK